MYTVELYLKVRQACVLDGKSARQVAKEFGISRNTISKMLKQAIPPGYKRTKSINNPKLASHQEFIDEILESDRKVHPKQRHTARRIFQRLQEERGYDGGYTIVRVYVAKALKKRREMFVPLDHRPGKAQVDFGEAWAFIGGLKKKLHLFIMDIPHSDACFIKAYERENTEAFLDGHVSAFIFFGGVMTDILYDNLKIAVARILGNGERKKTKAFTELQSHYLFKDHFARVGKGNDKGKVENLVGYARRNFMVPLPRVETIEELNKQLVAACLKRQEAILPKHKETIGQRLVRDEAAFMALPEGIFEACTISPGTISSQSLVRYKNNDYSVPVRYGYMKVLVKGFVDTIRIIYEGTVIAEHKRCYGRQETLFNPLHYLPLIERKVGALDQAAPLKDWHLPPQFERIKTCLVERDGKSGKREYVKILRLLESYKLEEITQALESAFKMGTISYEALLHYVLRQTEKIPETLDLSGKTHIPSVKVLTTSSKDYDGLREARI